MKKLTAKQKKYLKTAGWVGFGAATLFVARELYLAFGPRRDDRRKLYEAAEARAQALGRPLVVLGDPEGTLLSRALGRSWQCGNVCIDPKGCTKCGGPGSKTITGDYVAVLATLKPDSAVIYDSGVLGFADDAYALAAEMKRVSGGFSNLFVSEVERYTLASVFEPGRRRIITSAPPVEQQLAWKPLWWHASADTGTRNVGRGVGVVPALPWGSYSETGLGTIVFENYT